MISGQLLKIGPVVGTDPIVNFTYIQAYKNLCLVISPSRAPPSQIYLWHTFRRPANAFTFLVTSPYCKLYEAYLSAYKTKLVINMIIKEILNINALSLYLPSELRPDIHMLIYLCAHMV